MPHQHAFFKRNAVGHDADFLIANGPRLFWAEKAIIVGGQPGNGHHKDGVVAILPGDAQAHVWLSAVAGLPPGLHRLLELGQQFRVGGQLAVGHQGGTAV